MKLRQGILGKHGWAGFFAVWMMLFGQPASSLGQLTLNATNFGAMGDAVRMCVNTVSNSTTVSVTGTNVFSSADVGKVIEIFGAGPWLHFSNNPANIYIVTNQDIIDVITGVQNGTNISLSIPCGWTTNAVCIVGRNNLTNFQNCIDYAQSAVSNGVTNVTVSIPGGTYLIISSNSLNPHYIENNINGDVTYSLAIRTGGLSFIGDSTNAVLMGCGAGMCHVLNSTYPYSSLGFFNPLRGIMIECAGPISYSQYPLVFQNLTMDGGVINGLQSYNYYTLEEGNGAGWDTSHHALLDINSSQHPQMHQLKLFTNCVFQHWRGEMLICTTGPGGTNTFNDVANCTFYDGNASAINLYYGQHIHGCTFSKLVKVEEYYQANSTLPVLFEDNYWTNIVSNPVSIVGSTTNSMPPGFIVRNNILYGAANTSQFTLSPAENVTFSNNSFFGQANGITFTAAGLQPADGTASIIQNIVIASNSFDNTYLPVYTDGFHAANVLVSNNNASGSPGNFAYMGGGWKSNWVFVQNIGRLPVQAASVTAVEWPLDDPGNRFGPRTISDWTGVSNNISYGNGGRYYIQYDMANSVYYLDDSTPGLIPNGAQLYITNGWRSNAAVYFSTVSPNLHLSVPAISEITWIWTNSSWQLAPPAPPTGLTASLGN